MFETSDFGALNSTRCRLHMLVRGQTINCSEEQRIRCAGCSVVWMLIHLRRWAPGGQQSRTLDPEGHADSYVIIAKVRETGPGNVEEEDFLLEKATFVLSLKDEEESSRLKRRKENPDGGKTLFQGPREGRQAGKQGAVRYVGGRGVHSPMMLERWAGLCWATQEFTLILSHWGAPHMPQHWGGHSHFLVRSCEA